MFDDVKTESNYDNAVSEDPKSHMELNENVRKVPKKKILRKKKLAKAKELMKAADDPLTKISSTTFSFPISDQFKDTSKQKLI